MGKAKPIVKEKPLFELVHVDEAKEVVFNKGKSIMFNGAIEHIKGQIIVSPDGCGGANIKCRAWPIWSRVVKSMTVVCADSDDLENAFSTARFKLVNKMNELAKQTKRKPIK